LYYTVTTNERTNDDDTDQKKNSRSPAGPTQERGSRETLVASQTTDRKRPTEMD